MSSRHEDLSIKTRYLETKKKVPSYFPEWLFSNILFSRIRFLELLYVIENKNWSFNGEFTLVLDTKYVIDKFIVIQILLLIYYLESPKVKWPINVIGSVKQFFYKNSIFTYFTLFFIPAKGVNTQGHHHMDQISGFSD